MKSFANSKSGAVNFMVSVDELNIKIDFNSLIKQSIFVLSVYVYP